MAKYFIIMINLYIINESSRGAVYGIGTYLRELTIALKNSNIKIHVIHLRSEKQKKNPVESESIHHHYIPSPFSGKTSIDWNKQNELYYRNVVYLLKLKVKDTEKLVFHLNFNVNSKLVEELKRVFDCKLLLLYITLNGLFYYSEISHVLDTSSPLPIMDLRIFQINQS